MIEIIYREETKRVMFYGPGYDLVQEGVNADGSKIFAVKNTGTGQTTFSGAVKIVSTKIPDTEAEKIQDGHSKYDPVNGVIVNTVEEGYWDL